MKHNTLKAVKAVLAINEISIHKICGEYKVYPKGGRWATMENSTYFTTDLMDAMQTGLDMARRAGTLRGPDGSLIVTRTNDAVAQATLAQAVEFVNRPVVKPEDVDVNMEFKGCTATRINGRIYKVAANAYGNWYSYVGTKRESMFFGDYVDQMFEAASWIKTLQNAAALLQ
jgi:hypothetical protein